MVVRDDVAGTVDHEAGAERPFRLRRGAEWIAEERVVLLLNLNFIQVIKAQVPARELYRYSSNLRSLTGGRGIHNENFSHYEEMPHELEQRVIEESRRRNGDRKMAA